MKGGNYEDPCRDSGQSYVKLSALLGVVGQQYCDRFQVLNSVNSLSLPPSPSLSLPLPPSPSLSLSLSLDEW